LLEQSSVFVIDDDASMRGSITRLLREHGVGTTLFSSPNHVIEHDDFSSAVCLVIDVNLEGHSGIDLRRLLASRGVKTPVIYITGSDSSEDRLAAIESGCVAYLKKPFTADLLMAAIQRALVVEK
jgi:FixJ family two-component response regulator